VDEYAERMTQPLRAVYAEFQAGNATLLDLSRVAAQVAISLDNAHAELLALLKAADGDLEYGYYATEREDHSATAARVFGPILDQLERE
jgi:hypothetical protein